jgi:small-conductance mechanosensitive channel
MDFLRILWSDGMALAAEPLFSIGKTEITLLRLVGLVIIILIALRLASLVRRATLKLASDGADPGVYLLSRISGYGVWALCAIIGLHYLGFDLASFAFLGGALGVGIGFGLQNVFNNFVSGIIILLEKTLKVGDIVELQSGLTGKVAEINLRYTRITTGDMLDVLVPNSEFISSRVSSWSYGAGMRRLHIPFTVANGSDKELVREAGLVAASSVPGTITEGDYRPEVALTGMNRDGMSFELVVWIGIESLGRHGTVRNRNLWALETELKQRGIRAPEP